MQGSAAPVAGHPGTTLDETTVSKELNGLSLTSAPPPAPKLVSNGVVSVDITDKFVAAASTLEPGELVKDGYFTLFESVGALEIMDPKMDSGCLQADELVDDGYDLSRPLLPAELLGIIDELLCLEMAWHQGYPLSQTLLISVYINAILIPQPTSLEEVDFIRNRGAKEVQLPEHAVLRAYCLALIKTCWLVMESIKAEVYYEEEDFSTNTYHLSLLEDVSLEEIRSVLKEAQATTHDHEKTWTREVSSALEARLEFRENFLKAIELAELRCQPDSIKVPWLDMKENLEAIKKTHDLGTAVPDSFSVKLQRRLPSTMPPRPIVKPSFDEACQGWTQFSQDGAEAIDVLKYADPQSLLNFVLTFQAKKPQPLVFIRTLVQALIFVDNVMLGALSIRKVMDDDLALQVLPSSILLDPSNDDIEVVHDPRFAIARQMEEFRQRAFPGYLEMFRTMCQNRSRARRTLCHAIQEWEKIQVDAEDLDQVLQASVNEYAAMYGPGGTGKSGGKGSSSKSNEPPTDGTKLALPLSSWAFLYKLRLMEWVVQLGFELEVYPPDELAGMYWYLSSLARRRVQHAERIRSFTVRSLGEMRRAGTGSAFTAKQEAAFERSLIFLRMIMVDASVTWELSDALSCLYAVLQRTGVLPTPVRPYGTDALRYELRMKPFALVGLPELPTFDSFTSEVKQPKNSTQDILKYVESVIGDTKRGCEAMARYTDAEAFAAGSAGNHARWLASTKNVHKAAIFTGIAVATVRKAVDRVQQQQQEATAENLKLSVQVPKPGGCYHEWWIVPKIVPTA